MIKDITFFETTKELEKLTRLSHTELWENGFNLDDMDWGFVLNENYMIKDYDKYNDIYLAYISQLHFLNMIHQEYKTFLVH